jgi:hypothetical protein
LSLQIGRSTLSSGIIPRGCYRARYTWQSPRLPSACFHVEVIWNGRLTSYGSAQLSGWGCLLGDCAPGTSHQHDGNICRSRCPHLREDEFRSETLRRAWCQRTHKYFLSPEDLEPPMFPRDAILTVSWPPSQRVPIPIKCSIPRNSVPRKP